MPLFQKYLILLISFVLPAHSFAQEKFLKDPIDRALFEDGEYFYSGRFYAAALKNYQKLEEKFPQEPILLYRSAVCYLHQPDGKEKSLEYFNKLSVDNFEPEESYFYYGRSLHLNYKFNEAIDAFNKYLSSKHSTKINKKNADIYIQNCRNGSELMKDPLNIVISNFGPPVNTEASEYVPLITSDNRFIIFTYRGKLSKGGLKPPIDANSPPEGDYYEDVFYSELQFDNTWSVPQPIPGKINTESNDACVSMSDDGQKLFIFKSTEGDEGNLFISQRDGDEWGEPRLIYGKINSPWWEGSITLSSDGKTAYFSSDRPGGLGGKDLYSARLQPDGSWDEVKNMGPKVNTPGDEDAPFLHPSGFFMIYSSTSFNSMGGYDLFKVEKLDDTSWRDPVNLGYPINTPGDDIYYTISGDGKTGFYSSGKAGGAGRQDIYVVAPGNAGIDFSMVQVSGRITYNDQPVNAELRVDYTESGIPRMITKSNKDDGYYLVNLPADKNFTLRFSIPGEEPQVKNLSATGIPGFQNAEINISFYSKEYLRKLEEMRDTIKTIITPDPSFNSVDELLTKFGDYTLEGLTYHVQIGAYNMPDNFNYRAALKYGSVEKQILDDGITRFIIGTKFTLRESYVLRDKIISAGITDAFVTAEYEGKRYLIKDLAAKNFFMP